MTDKYVPIFYDWPEATKELNAQEKGRLIDAIVLYARGGDWQEQIKGNERYLFPTFQLEIERRKEVSRARAKAGEEGGKQTQANASKDKQTQANASKRYNKDKDNDNSKDNDNIGVTNARAARFTPPTVEQVAEYAKEKGYAGFNADRFCDFYASKGWKVGKDTMKDWQAAVRGWAARDKENAPRNQITTYKDVDWDKIGL